MITTWEKKNTTEKKWYLVDASNVVLGRLASYLALRLRGKHKSSFCPNLDCGDYFVVINAKNVRMTGKKLEQKTYYKHTGYPGGLKAATYLDILNGKNPENVIKLSVKRMMPKGVLGKEQFKKLYVYPDGEHPHSAQKPETIDFKSLNRKNSIGKAHAN